MPIQFTCHCKEVQLSVETLPEHFLQCNCSTCGRYGTKWAYYQPDQVSKHFEPKKTKGNVWGKEECEFFHCVKCGSLTHYELTAKANSKKIAINGRMLEDRQLMDSIPSKYFDGRDKWQMVDHPHP